MRMVRRIFLSVALVATFTALASAVPKRGEYSTAHKFVMGAIQGVIICAMWMVAKKFILKDNDPKK